MDLDKATEATEELINYLFELRINLKEFKDWISSQPMTKQEKLLFSKYGLILKTDEQRKLF